MFRRKDNEGNLPERKGEFTDINPQDIQHHALYNALKSNYLAPIKGLPTKTVLDVGCGTGIWGHEIMREFTNAQVVGFDLEAAPPNTSNIMTSYVQGNLLQGLPFKTSNFTYVHQRLLMGTIPATSWPFVIGELARVVRPGGWVELVESGNVSFQPQGPASSRLTEGILKISAMRGVDLRIISSLDRLMEQARLINIQTKTVAIPLGNWNGKAGVLLSREIQTFAQSFRDPFIRLLRYTPTNFDDLITALPREWDDYHSQYIFYFLIGQKPLQPYKIS